jgi:hypothetical protein
VSPYIRSGLRVSCRYRMAARVTSVAANNP